MRTCDPLTADDPLVREKQDCPACGKTFQAGDVITLVVLGPGDNEERRALAKAGQPYTAMAIPVHAACADPN